MSIYQTTGRDGPFTLLHNTATDCCWLQLKSEAKSDLLLGEASLGGDLVDLLLLQLQLGARVAHLKEAAASREGEVLSFKKGT